MADEIKGYLAQLRQALPCVAPVSARALKSLHKAKDYEGMLRLIRQSMNVQVRLTIAWVNSGGHKSDDGREAPAWIELPAHMPRYGTAAFRDLKLTIFLRKSFLAESTYDEAAVAIAHELSHVVLDSIAHPLRRVERAVDLTAMLLGFRLLYQIACYKEFHSERMVTTKGLGYLSPAEVNLANDIISRRNARFKFSPSVRSIAAYSRLPAVLAVCAATAAFPLYKVWEVHDFLIQQQTAMQIKLPKTATGHMILSDVRVGVREMTLAYKVSLPRRDFDIDALERGTRQDACASEIRTKIRDGAIYSYEFIDSSHAVIGRFAVASCP